jgi:transcriptional regulator with XRE-family HTH domain
MSDPFKFLGKAFEEARESLAYRVETVSLDFTEELAQRMKVLGIKRADLARKLEVSQPYVSKLLDGAGNFTLATLVKVAAAVGCDLKTHLATRDHDSMWVNFPHAAMVFSSAKVDGFSIKTDLQIQSEVPVVDVKSEAVASKETEYSGTVADSNELALAA